MSSVLNPEARRENARRLAASIGVGEDEAAALLTASAGLTANGSDRAIADQTRALLERTLAQVGITPGETEPTIEIIFGSAERRTQCSALWVYEDGARIAISRNRPEMPALSPVHQAEAIVVACYVSALVMKTVVGDRLPFGPRDPFIIDLCELGISAEMRTTSFEINGAYLAGAGAIGNAFLWTLRTFQPRGRLQLVDFDIVKPGNLNRQIFFSEEDLGKAKAQQLALRAQPEFEQLELVPREGRLQDLPERTDPKWLEEVVVGVDSLRARRALQDELPKRVFDASTTNIEEVVLHVHEQPTGAACMSCFHPPTPAELEHARHLANALGVGLADVQAGEISEAAARKIVAQHPSQKVEDLVGESYDSLFKALCGQQLLRSAEGQQALAPFAFVSVLAGALLAIEYVRWKVHGPSSHNGWRVSPWSAPNVRLQKLHPRREDCTFCRDPLVRSYVAELWG